MVWTSNLIELIADKKNAVHRFKSHIETLTNIPGGIHPASPILRTVNISRVTPVRFDAYFVFLKPTFIFSAFFAAASVVNGLKIVLVIFTSSLILMTKIFSTILPELSPT